MHNKLPRLGFCFKRSDPHTRKRQLRDLSNILARVFVKRPEADKVLSFAPEKGIFNLL
jgi:hypothetical protein